MENATETKRFYLHVTDLENPCMRKLEYRLRGTVGTNPKLWETMKGTALHSMLEETMKAVKEANGEPGEIPVEPLLEKSLRGAGTDSIEDVSEELTNEAVQELLDMYVKTFSMMHEQLAGISGFEVEAKVETPVCNLDDGTEIVITGTADLVLTNSDDTKTIVDYKSGKTAKKEHGKQVAFYMMQRGAQHGLILYPQTGKVKEVEPMTDEERIETDKNIQDIVAALNKAQEAIHENKPPVLEAKRQFLCMYCPYFNSPCRGL